MSIKNLGGQFGALIGKFAMPISFFGGTVLARPPCRGSPPPPLADVCLKCR